jgi:hypothetical protein
MDRRRADLIDRIALALFGALAGYVLWLLSDIWHASGGRAALAALVGGTVFAGAALGMTGPVPPIRAFLLASPPGLVSGVLVFWASFRFDTARGFAASLHPFAALALFAILAMPFLIALGVDRRQWRAYPVLFREAWSFVVRLAAAGLFTGLFWLGYGLSDQLFRLVEIAALADLVELEGFVPALTGLVFGLALAVLDELAAGASPALAVRLLRLLILPAAGVIAVFLGQLGLRGAAGLPQGLSAATLLLAFAALAVTLVAAAVEGDDARAVRGLPMRALTRLLALSVLPLAAGAGWAVAARVAQYGWSPARLAAAALVLAGLAYGAGYLFAVLRGARFALWVRRVNKAAALGLIAVAAAWLTPLLDAERISAHSQAARFADGRATAADVDLDALRRDWGRSGRAALDRMAGMTDAPDRAALAARLRGDATGRTGAAALPGHARRALAGPQGDPAAAAVLAALDPGTLALVDDACARRLAGGVPGCALVVAEFLPDRPGEEAMLLLAAPGTMPGLTVLAFARTEGGGWREASPPGVLGQPLHEADAAATIAAARAGDAVIGPPSIRALRIGEVELLPRP